MRRHVFTSRVPVRWIDQDALGHVNNSRYFTYFEQARIEWMAQLDVAWQQGQGPVVARAACDYKRPITYPAVLEIRLLIDPPGRSSFQTYYEVRVEGDPDTVYALGEATMVWVDVARGRPITLPEVLRTQFQGE